MKAYFLYIFLFLSLSLSSCAQKPDTSMKFAFDPSYNLPKTNVEKMPEFPGGPKEMMKYIKENTHYPESAKKAGVQGKCFIKFLVTGNGSIDSVAVLYGVTKCAECDAEAIRVVKSMPKWKPGLVNKKPTPLYFSVPIIFKNQQ